MPIFKIGDKVISIDNEMHGVVTKVTPRRGRVLYKVMFKNGESDILETDLRADFDVSDPFERCKSGIFGSYADYSKQNTTFKIRNSNNSTISSLKASRTLFRAYQFKPLLKFLNSPNRRLLVADEVGLGKTIEAGHILLELKARKELKNVLIICPKSLEVKWKEELYEKFGLAFKICESAKDLIADLSSRTENIRAIVNYEKIRMPKKEDGGKAKDGSYTSLIRYISDHPQNFSMVLCDEAHKMRNRETQTYKGAEVITNCADAVLFLTATPIMISEENLYNLLHLLDNTKYYNYQIFRNLMNENRPFIEAITQVNSNVPLKTIRQKLIDAEVDVVFSADEKEIYSSSTTIGKVFENDPVFSEILKLMTGSDTYHVRARLQYLLSSMSVMNTVFSRTRKREVTTDMSQAERRPHVCKIALTDEEQTEFDNVIEDYTEDNSYTDYWGEERLTLGGALGLVQRKRQVASSVWAYLNTDSDLEKGFDAYSDREDTKVNELIKVINTVFENGTKKIVVFALFRKTLKYLSIRLKKAGFNSIMIHGLINNRAELLKKFKDDKNIHVLLSSEVGSEGLDMQFCNSMVNYDLPWNPMVVEQRIGRIDRFGQKSPVVNIYNFIVAGSIQEDIYMRLLDRIGIFRGTIGDMEAILDAEVSVDGKKMSIQDVYNKMENEFFTKELTKREKEHKIEEVERAIENEKLNLQNLQEGLNNTLTNDAYFRDEINRILYKNAYVTQEELQNYVVSLLRLYLTTCNIKQINKDVWEFSVPLSDPKVLINFLTRFSSGNDESQINVRQFKNYIEDKHSFLITFSQEKAYDNPSMFYLNIYHPMIQACLNYFVANADNTQTSFSYALPADDKLHSGDRYYMGIYQFTSEKNILGVQKKNVELMPVVYNLQTDKVEDNQSLTDHIFRCSQIDGSEHNVTNKDTDAETLDDISFDFAEYISSVIKNKIKEENNWMESERLRNVNQVNVYYSARIQSLERSIKEQQDMLEMLFERDDKYHGNTIPLLRANIKKLEKERDERLALINESKPLQLDGKLLSLNFVTII